MEGIDSTDERLHDPGRVGRQLLDALPEQLEVAELGYRQLGEGGLVRERDRQRGIVADPEERRQRGVCQQPEQVEDAVGRRLRSR